MSVLTTSADESPAADPYVTLKCDICAPPSLAVNKLDHFVSSGWLTSLAGHPFEVCPVCRRRFDKRELLRLRDRHHTASDAGAMPTFAVIGASKAGTTSLYAYLAQHPEISMSTVKEPGYFCDPERARWRQLYRQMFDPSRAVRGECTANYSAHPWLPNVAARMADEVPDMKIIYMVRDPVERAVAHFAEQLSNDDDRRDIESAFDDVTDPFNPYVAVSRYVDQIAEYRAAFGSMPLVVDTDRLRDDRCATLTRIYRFLGVSDEVEIPRPLSMNSRADKRHYPPAALALRQSRLLPLLYRLPPLPREIVLRPARRLCSTPTPTHRLSPATMSRLRAHLAPQAARLRSITGQEFASWSV